MVDNEPNREELMSKFKRDPEAHHKHKRARQEQRQAGIEKKQSDRQAVTDSLVRQAGEAEQALVDAAASSTIDRMPVGTNLAGELGDKGNPEDVATGGRRRLTPKR